MQRVPDSVEPTDPPEAMAGLSGTDRLRPPFEIVRFRWLSATEV